MYYNEHFNTVHNTIKKVIKKINKQYVGELNGNIKKILILKQI